MSGRLDYIHSEVDLELVKYKLEKALQNSQVQNSKKTQRRSRQKVTPDTNQVVTISEKKPSISLLLKQKLFALALFCLVFIIIILAIIIATTSKEGGKDVRQGIDSSTLITTLPAKTSTAVQTSTIVQEVNQCIEFNDVNVTITNDKVNHKQSFIDLGFIFKHCSMKCFVTKIGLEMKSVMTCATP